MTITVLRPGMLTTVQDLGRPGFEARGIGRGGAVDADALRVANALVGNAAGAAALEITLSGPTLRLAHDTLLALTGAPCTLTVGDEVLPRQRAVLVRAGTELAIGPAPEGCRAYLAVAGGIDIPPVLGSRSTHLRAGFGGVEGRALRAGDVLAIGAPSPASVSIVEDLGTRRTGWSADRLRIAEPAGAGGPSSGPVRAIRGPHFHQLDAESRRLLATASYRVSPQSDRMGCRLIGPILRFVDPVERISEAVVTGTIQLPPDGQPIVLLADRQTTGGYPVIGHVISADRSLMAQRRPGDALAFAWVTLEAAEQAPVAHRRALELSLRGLTLQRAGR